MRRRGAVVAFLVSTVSRCPRRGVVGFRFREVLSVPFSVAAARLARTRRRKIGSLVVPSLALCACLRWSGECGRAAFLSPLVRQKCQRRRQIFSAACFAVHSKSPPYRRAFAVRYAGVSLRGFGRGSFLRVPGGRLPRGKRQRLRAAPSSRKSALGKDGGLGGKGTPCAPAKGFPSPQLSLTFTKKGRPGGAGSPAGGNPPEGTILEHFQFETL